ncbi:MAG: FtsX-like permease family protein [Gammaproteobacteria bacterium]|nr:FtsX-like permease family protein [Gammaproteobacteria bacterium]
MSIWRTLIKSHGRFLRRHPVGVLATLIGITLAVMAVATVHLVSQSIRSTFDTLPGGSFAHTHLLTAPSLSEQVYFRLRQRWRQGQFPTVAAMAPAIDDFMDLAGQPVRIIGFDPLAGLAPATTPQQPSGRPDASFLTQDTALATAATAEAIRRAGLAVAVVEATSEAPYGDAPAVLLADLPTAQRMLDRESEIDAVWLRVHGARAGFLDVLDAILPGITAALPRYADPVVDDYRVVATRRWNPASRFADAMAFSLGALAMLSLLMAALVAAQASYSHVARRRLEQERLVAIGVSRRALRGLGLSEGLVLGAVGTAAGLALGTAVGKQLLATAFDGTVTTSTGPWLIAKAVLCGVAAATVGPVLATRGPETGYRVRHVLGGLGIVVAVFGIAHGSLLSAFAALTGLCAVQMVYTVPLFGSAASRFAALTRAIGARANLRAAAVRVGELRLALGALSVAVATAIGMGLMVESLRHDFTTMLEERLWPGVYVNADDPVTAADMDWIRDQPGVQAVRRYADVNARLLRGPASVGLATLTAEETRRYGFAGQLTTRGMVNEVGARLFGLSAGDTVTVVADGEHVDVEVGHVFRDFGAPTARVILPTSHYVSQFPAEAVRWRRLAVLADSDALAGLTASLAERFGTANVRNQGTIRAVAMDVFDRTFVVSRSLTSVALAVAVLGLYAALTALQASREREFQLLGAIGYGRAEVWRLAMVQSAILGVVAAVSAVPLGFVIAWLLCNVIQPLAFGWSIDLRVDLAAIALPVLLGIVGAAAAGVVPAYRSSFGQRAAATV